MGGLPDDLTLRDLSFALVNDSGDVAFRGSVGGGPIFTADGTAVFAEVDATLSTVRRFGGVAPGPPTGWSSGASSSL